MSVHLILPASDCGTPGSSSETKLTDIYSRLAQQNERTPISTQGRPGVGWTDVLAVEAERRRLASDAYDSTAERVGTIKQKGEGAGDVFLQALFT